MKKLIVLVLVAALCFSAVGCYTFNHKIGNGAQGSNTVTQKQWFVLWGLVPINQVDSKALAGGAADYNVKTQFDFVDVIITAFTGMVTVHVQTVTVTK